jgi:hypothetical protein
LTHPDGFGAFAYGGHGVPTCLHWALPESRPRRPAGDCKVRRVHG